MNTLAFSLERGNRVAKVVTPMVQRVVREFFNCSTLQGAELENQHTSTGACWGSHWEERLFNTDLMSPVASKFTVYSKLTLAYLEDSGWYKAVYNTTQPALWGYKRGCGFATGGGVSELLFPLTFNLLAFAEAILCSLLALRSCSFFSAAVKWPNNPLHRNSTPGSAM